MIRNMIYGYAIAGGSKWTKFKAAFTYAWNGKQWWSH